MKLTIINLGKYAYKEEDHDTFRIPTVPHRPDRPFGMRSLIQVIVLASGLFFSAVGAIPAKECAYNVKERIEAPRGWVKHSKPRPDHRIVLRIGLPQPNFSQLEKHLYEVSDPDHERYGQHLSKAEVEQLVAPHQESVDSVNDWLLSFGLKEDDLVHSPARDWVTIKVPVSLAEKMLDTVSFIDATAGVQPLC